MIRIEFGYARRYAYTLKLAAHEQNTRPHALLCTVEVALSITQENFCEPTKATLFLFVDLLRVSLHYLRAMKNPYHCKLEPQPILGRHRHLWDCSPRGLEFAHEFIECKLERVCRCGMQHVCIVYCLQVVTMGFG
jgi:hypothetical protein